MRNQTEGRAWLPTQLKLVAALAISLASMAAGPAISAPPDPFDVANSYYGGKYGVPDFKFTKSEFGNSNFGRLFHLGVEAVVEHKWGATVVYNPAKNEVLVYVDAGAPFNGKIIYANSKCKLLSGITALGNPGPDGICLPADTLVGNNGGPAYSHTIPAQARSCTFDAGKDGFDVHTC